jgi:hypothetical protein
MEFREEMRQEIQKVRHEKELAEQERNGIYHKQMTEQACELCIEDICDMVRNGIREQVQLDNVQYDVKPETLFTSEKKINPHYLFRLELKLQLSPTECEVSHRVIQEYHTCIVTVCETDTLFYVLEESERRLRQDGIYPVDSRQVSKKYHVMQSGHTVDAEVRRTLQLAAEMCQARRQDGHPDVTVDINYRCKFAYFVTD